MRPWKGWIVLGIIGVLVSSRMGLSVTGKLAYACTYRIGTDYTTVTLDHLCPATMQFQ